MNEIKISIENLNILTFIIKIISPKRLYVKGPPKFAIHNKNQSEDIMGNRFNLALFNIILRE